MNSNGYILLTCLVIQALLGIAFIQVSQLYMTSLQLSQEQTQRRKLTEILKMKPHEKIQELSPALVAYQSSAARKNFTQTHRLLLARDKTFPLIDYDRLFRTSEDCKTFKMHNDIRRDHSSHLLTISSYRSTKTCIYKEPVVLDGNLIIDGNLEIQSEVLVPDTPTGYIIAATGYISISQSLTLEGPIIFVSGGDMLLQTLKSTEKQTVRFLSASGTFIISDSSSSIIFSGAAKKGVFLPAGKTLLPFSYPALHKEKILISVQRGASFLLNDTMVEDSPPLE